MAGRYDREVRLPGGDPHQLALLAPPMRRASLHGFLLGLWVWLLILLPVFELDHGRPLRGTAAVGVLTVLWIFIFRSARRTDRALQAAYRARRCCAGCGFEEVAPSLSAG